MVLFVDLKMFLIESGFKIMFFHVIVESIEVDFRNLIDLCCGFHPQFAVEG